ncbi:hypothetical protein ACX93W_01755 [Paenibacillus sp. CAU 1782]
MSYYDDLRVDDMHRTVSGNVEFLRGQLEELRQDIASVKNDVSRRVLANVIAGKTARLAKETATLEKWAEAKALGLEYVDWDYV